MTFYVYYIKYRGQTYVIVPDLERELDRLRTEAIENDRRRLTILCEDLEHQVDQLQLDKEDPTLLHGCNENEQINIICTILFKEE